jgi:hypothetical protein
MPIALDSLPIPDPHAVTLPGSVTISVVMHSTGTANTMATVTYSIDPASDVFMAGAGGPSKAMAAGPFIVPVPPGLVHDDTLPLVRGAGEARALVPIALEVQERDADGAPAGAAMHRNVVIQIL